MILCTPPQEGEGTPTMTGLFEVTVGGKLVHSKKVGRGGLGGVIVCTGIVVVQALYGSIAMRWKYRGTSSMNCRARGSHVGSVYPTLPVL